MNNELKNIWHLRIESKSKNVFLKVWPLNLLPKESAKVLQPFQGRLKHTFSSIQTALSKPISFVLFVLKAPFICNGCEKRTCNYCQFKRQLYVAKQAQADCESLLVESQTGIPLNQECFHKTENVISSAVRFTYSYYFYIILVKYLPQTWKHE